MATPDVDALGDTYAALRSVARVERRVWGRGTGSGEDLLVAQRWAWRPGAADLPALQGHPEVDAADRLTASTVRADAVVVGRLRHARLRSRAFYLGEDPSSLVVQQRRWSGGRPRPSHLATAARLQQRWGGLGPHGLRAPRVRAHGGGLRTVWLHEDLHPGVAVDPERWSGLAPAAGAGLLEGHRALGVWRERVDVDAVRAATHELESLLADPGLGVGRALARAGRTPRDWQASLARCRGEALVGWCHGDPVRGNWLQHRDRLVLLDWELAGRRAVVHDLLKLLTGTPRPDQADLFERVVRGSAPSSVPGAAGQPQVLPWSQQAAVTLVLGLARWRDRVQVAERSGRERELRARLRGQVLLLDALLAR